MGLALGVGFYEAALAAGLAVFSILTLLQKWDDKLHRNTKIIELYIEISESYTVGNLIRDLRDLNLEVESLQMEQDVVLEDNARPLIATLKSKKRGDHNILLEKIKQFEGIVHLEEL